MANTNDPSLPNARAALVDARGLPASEWRKFFEKLSRQPTLTADQSAEIAALAERVSALEAEGVDLGQIIGLGSVSAVGSLGDQVVIQLQGDEDAPTASYYYGTDDTGVRGWHPLALESLSNVDLITTPPVAGDALLFDGVDTWAPGAVLANPMTTPGDMIVGGVAGAPTAVPAGTINYVWTSNGAGVAPSWQAAGGGALTNWTEAVSVAAPNATIPVVSFTPNNAATNVDAAIIPKGTNGALLGQVPDNLASGGNKRGSYATDWQRVRAVNTRVASGFGATMGGGQDNTSGGQYSTVAGGLINNVSGNYATASGRQNTVAGTNATAFGFNNTASQASATALGTANSASGTAATAYGDGCTASGTSSVASGAATTASAAYSEGRGRYATTRTLIGSYAYASYRFSSSGDAQREFVNLAISTTNATPAVMTSDATAASANNTLTLPNSSAFAVEGVVICREQATGDAKHFKFDATITRGANAAATALVGTATVTTVNAAAGAAAWTVAVTANTTLGGLAVTVTGEAAKSIKWVATLRAVEVSG